MCSRHIWIAYHECNYAIYVISLKYRVIIKSLDHFNRLKKIEKLIEKIPTWCQKTRYVLKFCSVSFMIFFDLCMKSKLAKY